MDIHEATCCLKRWQQSWENVAEMRLSSSGQAARSADAVRVVLGYIEGAAMDREAVARKNAEIDAMGDRLATAERERDIAIARLAGVITRPKGYSPEEQREWVAKRVAAEAAAKAEGGAQ
jgi:hypothetical protein